MTETRRLYYEDVYKKEFTATVVECREQKKGYAVILDESAFYPEGGGQPSDVGTLGDAKVTEVHEKDGELLHYTDKALEVGAKVEGKVVSQVKSAKVVVYKYKAKKNERKKQGHRQPYTKVEITAING